MKFAAIKSAALSLFLLAGASICGAATLTVGPTGQYATPCPAIHAAAAGDTITIDYNNGIPYNEPAQPSPNGGTRSDCVWATNNLTIVGVNGRPILDAAGETIEKGIFNPYGANNVISNLEFRNAATQPGQGSNGAGIRVDSGGTAAPAGGNITVQYCYIHDNEDGILTANVGPGTGGAYFSANPYITFLNDEFAYNGVNGDGHTHNFYIGFDGGNTTAFTLEYSWTHDVNIGHTIKTRAPINNILYNLITDQLGATSYMLNFPLGGSTYIVGNSVYKSQKTNSNSNGAWMLWRDVGDNTPTDPEYGLPLEDLHFINNTVVLDPTNNTPAYVIASCIAADANSCSAPSNGPVLSVNEVVQNNIFIGPASIVTNQTTAVASNNIVEANNSANLAAMFVDWAHFNFHLAAGAPAIQAGLYPPTDNTGAADPKALAAYEYVQPISEVVRPTPSGTHMDGGAYSYPRVDTPPSPTLTYTTSVTTPGTGTITLTGLPTPPAGKYNNASFISGNKALIPAISSASSTTGTITTNFSACCAPATTVVPIDIYVDGAYLTANVTVVPGPVALQSVTLDNAYYPETTVHLTNASSSPVVVDLTTTDASILAVPATVTIPAGQLSAETGSETGSLWGQSPPSKTATISATYAGSTKSLPVTVYAPYVNHFYCNVYPCTVIGGQPIDNFQVAIAGDFPAGGGPVTFISDTPSVIPTQTFTAPGGNFYTGFILTTNNVTTNTTVTISISVNGSTKTPLQVVTVTPASGTNIAVSSGSGQAAGVGTNFSNPLVALVQNGSTPVSGATVTFSGAGVNFPNGATAVTNSSGLASVAAQPATTGALTVTANTAGAGTPATFSETGTSAGGSGPDVVTIDSGGDTAGTYAADEYFTGGGPATPTTSVIDTSQVTNPAPQAVYQSWRFGACSYAIPGLTPGANYTVRLHFAEGLKTGPGQREFNVAINNSPVLTNFDIFATAGAANKAIAESFAATADSNGQISIQITQGAVGNAQINGIEIQSTVPVPTVTAVSGSGQSATVGTPFTNPLVVLVKDAAGNPASGTTVTFAGTGVSFPSGATAVSDSNGNAQVTAQPTSTGAITITASIPGGGSPANFTETGNADTPTSIAAVSGSGQTAAAGTNFTSPLVVVVQDASNHPVSGTTVTFAGSGVSFPGGATAVTDSNGNAQVTAQPTGTGTLTITASVAGVSTPATFSETGTAGAPATVTAVSGSGQSAVVGTPFSSPLVALVKDANGNAVSGVTVSFAGTGVSFPGGATAVTNASGQASVTAQPTTTGALTITASVAGATSASFSETGTAGPPASIAAVSGSGQSAPVGNAFTNPLVVVVKDATGNAVSGATVTFAGSGITFPAGATAVTNASGMAQVTAQPTTTGAHTITASVAGVATSASFSETGTAAIQLSSVTIVGSGPGTRVNLSGKAVSPVVVTLSSSNSSVVVAPTTVTVPTGSSYVNVGTLLGSLWTPASSARTATITATYNGVTKTLTTNFYSPSLHSFACSPSTCPAVVGGVSYKFSLSLAGTAPVGGGTIQFISDNPAVIPNQTVTVPAGQNNPSPNPFSLTTNVVTTTATVHVTANFNGTEITAGPITVNPAAEIASVTSDGSTNPGTRVNLTAPAPTGGVVVHITSSDSTIASAPASVTVPAGQTYVEIGTVLGSLWTPAGTTKTATISASFNGITKSLAKTYTSPGVAAFSCTISPCPTVVGGNTLSFQLALSGSGAPVGGATVQITSNNPAVVPNQTVTVAAGQTQSSPYPFTVNTVAVTKNTVVTVSASYNGSTRAASGGTITVTPAPPPASIAAVSGGGQTGIVGSPFANPLVVLVEDAASNPVPNATVTFAGSGVSFPSGATATTNSSGQAQVTAQPTSTGPLTITASVTGVGTSASFAETGTGGLLSSITQDSPYQSGTTVHLAAAATAPVVVTLSSSDSSIEYIPATVTIPTGQSSVETGSLLGSLWGQTPTSKTAVVTATYAAVTKTLTMNVPYTTLHSFNPNSSVQGGQLLGFYVETAFNPAPVGGAPYTISSDQPSIIPTQSFTLAAGQSNDFGKNLVTNPVSTTTVVNITLNYNGALWGAAITVTP